MTEFESSKQRILAMGGEGQQADVAEALKLAEFFETAGDQKLLATAMDVAYGLQPDDDSISSRRLQVLDSLSVVEHGIDYRYVPAGTFLMGSADGDPDERPVHAVFVDEYWVGKVPVTWSRFCELMGWLLPPDGRPDIEFSEEDRMQLFHLHEMNKVRLIYCETETTQGGGWHRHVPQSGEAASRFGVPPRENADTPFRYDVKPMVAISVREVEDLCGRISNERIVHRLPSERQWEKAARGGLVGASYSWGDAEPDSSLCDFNHFGNWRLYDPLRFPPNGYGLHGMCGTVWEWTRDFYDALAYSQTEAPKELKDTERQYVLRGGSWVDCPEAIRVSFRMSRSSGYWKDATWGGHGSPNIGFRLVREKLG